jgi:serine/threonine-protein kinase SRPK3
MAEASATEGQAEVQAFQFLKARSSTVSGPNHVIIQMLDHFIHKGPNGRHTCLVLELLGPSLESVITRYIDQNQKIPAKTVFRFSKQLLQAVDFLHSSGIAHGGELF